METARGAQARPVLSSVAQVARWRAAGGGPCDVMVDTGMNRLGLTMAEATGGALEGLAIETLMSHLACADEPGHPLNARQLAAFRALKARVSARRYSLANSAGILLGADYAFDLTRPGIALYGGVQVPAAQGAIRAVVGIEAQVLQVRRVPAGETVGYGATWRAERDTDIAILNLGYADGYMRGFMPGAHALWQGRHLPLAGRISMDLIAVDASEAGAGDSAVGEGDWLGLELDLSSLSGRSGLSQYELLTGLNHRFDRRWR
jgi:alanine racemase